METVHTRPPLRVNNRRDILVLDRDVRKINDVFMMIAAVPCKEVKFGLVSTNSRVMESTSEPQFPNCNVKIIEDWVPAAVDLLHGFSFPVSVRCFRFWVEKTGEGWQKKTPSELGSTVSNYDVEEIDIIDLRNSSHAVKEVRFETPIVITPDFRFCASYIPNPREFSDGRVCFDYDDAEYKYLIVAHFTVSVLAADERAARRDGLTVKTFRPLETAPASLASSAIGIDREEVESIEDRKPQYARDEKWLPINIKPTVILRDGSIYDKNVVEIDLEGFTLRK